MPGIEREAMRLWDLGRRSTYIATTLGVNPSTVTRWAHKNGKKVDYPSRKVATIDVKEIVKLRKKTTRDGKPTFSHREIAELVECSKSRVAQILNEARKKDKNIP